MKTIEDLARELQERDLSLIIHSPGSPWVVWLFAEDDPAIGTFVGEGATITFAIEEAIA